MKNAISAPELSDSIELHPALSAVAGEVPILGGLVNCWAGIVQERKEKKIIEFLHEVAAKINELAYRVDKIDEEHIKSDAFTNTLAVATQICANSSDDTKKEYLKNYVANFSLNSRPDYELVQVYASFLNMFSGVHFLVLCEISHAQSKFSNAELRVLAEQLHRREAISVSAISQRFNISLEVADAVSASLGASGLIQRIAPPQSAQDQTDTLIICPLGKAFVGFISNDLT